MVAKAKNNSIFTISRIDSHCKSRFQTLDASLGGWRFGWSHPCVTFDLLRSSDWVAVAMWGCDFWTQWRISNRSIAKHHACHLLVARWDSRVNRPLKCIPWTFRLKNCHHWAFSFKCKKTWMSEMLSWTLIDAPDQCASATPRCLLMSKAGSPTLTSGSGPMWMCVMLHSLWAVHGIKPRLLAFWFFIHLLCSNRLAVVRFIWLTIVTIPSKA